MIQHKFTLVFLAFALCAATAVGETDSQSSRETTPEQEHKAAGEKFQLSAGTRVRIHLSEASDPVDGNVIEIDGRNVTLISEAGTQLGIPRNSIVKLEVHNGKKQHALLGLVLGVGAGAIIGAIEGPTCDGENCSTRSDNISTGAIGAGVLGLLTGMLIKTDRWIEVPGEHFHVQLNGLRGGAAVSFAFSF